MSDITPGDDILVVGAGVFGLSIALELRRRGHGKVTVLDRMLPPVPDGSSCDISRIVRNDYLDPFWAQLATEAIRGWKRPPFDRFFNQSMYVLLDEGDRHEYMTSLRTLQREMGTDVVEMGDSSQITERFPCLNRIKPGFSGYANPDGAWADAAGAIKVLASLCSEAGVSIVTGPRGTVTSLQTAGSRISGVVVACGPPLTATKVIVAAGAWTNHLLDLETALLGTAQPIGFIQLTSAEAESLKGMPVVMNTSTGFFVFPPDPKTHVLKVAIHGHGYTTRQAASVGSHRTISAPSLHHKNATETLPPTADDALRRGLKGILPQFSQRPWMKQRLCWYTDTRDANFVVDYHPSIDNLFIATGGSGQ